METLQWKMDGEWLTNFMRHRLWIDRESYSKVENMMMDILKGGQDIDEYFKREVIRQILCGDQKLVGINHFTVEDDDDHRYPYIDLSIDNLLKIIYQLKDQNCNLMEQLADLNSELNDVRNSLDQKSRSLEEYVEANKELNEIAERILKQFDPIEKLRDHLQHSSIIDSISWYHMFGDNISEDVSKRIIDFCNQYNMYIARSSHGDWEWFGFYDKDTEKSLTTDDLIERGVISLRSTDDSNKDSTDNLNEDNDDSDENSFEPEYGFVTPSGNFISSLWGTHTEKAHQIIDENGWHSEYNTWWKSTGKDSVDFLIQIKGFVLLHNPMRFGYTKMSCNNQKFLTKKQKDFLFSYFMKEGNSILANSMMED